jgi:hypothetical protein
VRLRTKIVDFGWPDLRDNVYEIRTVRQVSVMEIELGLAYSSVDQMRKEVIVRLNSARSCWSKMRWLIREVLKLEERRMMPCTSYPFSSSSSALENDICSNDGSHKSQTQTQTSKIHPGQ